MNKNVFFVGIGSLVGLYAVLCLVSQQLANVVLTWVIILGGALIGCYFAFKQPIYALSIYLAPKDLRKGNSTLVNKNMTIQYFAGNKIMAMDNFCETDAGKRTFTIDKKKADINVVWFEICRHFNKSTTIGALSGHIRKYVEVDITNIKPAKVEKIETETKAKKKVIDHSVYERSPESYRPKPKVPEIADFNNLQAAQNATKKEEEAEYVEEFLNMNDIMQKSASKVNINTATASELALVPGINIASAKKLIEYRDLNGKFETLDEVLMVVEIKDHFMPKVKEMLVFDDTNTNPQNDASIEKQSEGRLLDW